MTGAPMETPTNVNPEPHIVSARATIRLPGLVPGRVYPVDLRSRYVSDCVAAGYLVLEPDGTTATGAAADET